MAETVELPDGAWFVAPLFVPENTKPGDVFTHTVKAAVTPVGLGQLHGRPCVWLKGQKSADPFELTFIILGTASPVEGAANGVLPENCRYVGTLSQVRPSRLAGGGNEQIDFHVFWVERKLPVRALSQEVH